MNVSNSLLQDLCQVLPHLQPQIYFKSSLVSAKIGDDRIFSMRIAIAKYL
ncbi:hypothetical protein [Nostoc sp. CALU 546]